MKVLSFGEILWDIIEGNAHLGGAPLNFAAHAAQCGAESYMISRLGEDDFGKKAYDQLPKVDVNRSLVQMDPEHPTGTVDVYLDKGQPTYTIHPQVAYDFISYDELASDLGDAEYDVFYFGTLAQRGQRSRETLYQILESRKFASRFYDVNFRKDCYSKETVLKSLEYSDILKLNDEEVELISEYMYNRVLSIDDFVKACYDSYGHKVIIVTAGGEGCYVYTDQQMHHVEGRSVSVADAVGAGDSFSAAFMYKYFHSNDPLRSAWVGNQVGGYVASQHGAIPEYDDELRQLLGE